MPAASRNLWLGIDLGTQSLKAVLWRPAADGHGGEVVGEGSRPYGVRYPRPGWAEQSPTDWEAALAPAVAEALARARARPGELCGLGVTGQLDGTIAIDRHGDPLGPALIWQDKRASCELPLGAAQVQALSGQIIDASHLAPKARYLLRELGSAVTRVHQPVSYLVERLTGRAVMDPALASMTLLLDLAERRWSDELCAAWGLPLALLPELAAAYQMAAPLTARGAHLTGLQAGLPVCVGTGDDFAAALGAGLVHPGRVSCSLGTAQVVGALSSRCVLDRGGGARGDASPAEYELAAEPVVETHLYPTGHFYVENPGWTCGAAVSWLRRLVGFADDRELDAAAAAVAPGADGVGFFPALAGAMAPAWVAEARGAFVGLGGEHDRGHLARAVLEGCAFACRDVVDRLRQLDVPVERVLLSGGGSHSALWAQLHADVLDCPVELTARADATAVGAAMLAAICTAAVTLDELPRLAGAPRRTFAPEPSAATATREAYVRYRRHAAALIAAARPPRAS